VRGGYESKRKRDRDREKPWVGNCSSWTQNFYMTRQGQSSNLLPRKRSRQEEGKESDRYMFGMPAKSSAKGRKNPLDISVLLSRKTELKAARGREKGSEKEG